DAANLLHAGGTYDGATPGRQDRRNRDTGPRQRANSAEAGRCGPTWPCGRAKAGGDGQSRERSDLAEPAEGAAVFSPARLGRVDHPEPRRGRNADQLPRLRGSRRNTRASAAADLAAE